MYRFHTYGNPSVPGTIDLTSDAFTQTAYKYGKALKEIGHYVIMYGTKEFASEFICDEFIGINSVGDFIDETSFVIDSKKSLSFDSNSDSKRSLIEKYSRGAYLSNMLNEKEEKEKAKIVEKSRNNLSLFLNNNTIKKNDIFLTFWDIYHEEAFKKIEEAGGIVIEGLCQYGTSSWTPQFNRTVFSSLAELNRRYEMQQFASKHHIVIPPFFDPNEFTYCKKDPLNAEEKIYLYLARIQEYKGFGIIVSLAKKFPNKIFWVAGEAKTLIKEGNKYLEYQKYDKSMSWLNLTEIPNLIYKGLADKQLRKELLSKASVLIQPSMYDEPFGWNVIEANLSGTPVVTSNRGAFLDTVKEGINGYRLDPTSSYEKWEEVLDKAQKLSSKECYNFAVKNYNVDYIMSQYIQYIEKVLLDKGSLFNEL